MPCSLSLAKTSAGFELYFGGSQGSAPVVLSAFLLSSSSGLSGGSMLAVPYFAVSVALHFANPLASLSLHLTLLQLPDPAG